MARVIGGQKGQLGAGSGPLADSAVFPLLTRFIRGRLSGHEILESVGSTLVHKVSLTAFKTLTERGLTQYIVYVYKSQPCPPWRKRAGAADQMAPRPIFHFQLGYLPSAARLTPLWGPARRR